MIEQASEIRQHFRKLRRTISIRKQQRNAFLVSENINALLGFHRQRRVADYLSTQGELSLNTWISTSPRQNIYLPKLYEPVAPRLRFAPFSNSTRWMRNRFSIVEPDTHWGQTLAAQKLDIILLPLVAFDRRGGRMGMGGGYYDRTLAFRKNRKHWARPRLVGIAHSCQEHPELPENPWDVRLDVIITEEEIILPGNSFQK